MHVTEFFRPMIRWLAWLLLAARLAAGAPAPIVLSYSPPTLLGWVQPAYPPEAAKAKGESRVLVEFVVETDGSVSREKVKETGGPGFDEAALAAVRQWKFKPGVDEKKPAAMAMSVPVVFELAQLSQKQVPLFPPERLMPRVMQSEPARLLGSMEPEYPAELEERKLPGSVVIEFTVDETGRARLPKVLNASHPAFVETALRTLEQARFNPARQGPLPYESKMKSPMEFVSMGALPAAILRANHLEIVGEPPSVLPLPLMLIQPVYPHDRLMAGESGTAEIEFSVNEEGRPGLITVTSASAPEFGAALKAAVEAWAFRPARSGQAAQAVKLKAVHVFAPEANPADQRLVRLLQPGGAGVGAPKGLDRKLIPLWRGYPIYPPEFIGQQLEGQSEVEFIIDREGRARLPRVLKASEEGFGWAAATAISQWVFERPTRAGEAVDVTVRIPVSFQPPKAE
jgi:TonB family protein